MRQRDTEGRCEENIRHVSDLTVTENRQCWVLWNVHCPSGCERGGGQRAAPVVCVFSRTQGQAMTVPLWSGVIIEREDGGCIRSTEYRE